jgi:RNA polymerase-binding transcription factor DksA
MSLSKNPFAFLSSEYIAYQKEWLHARRDSKLAIIREGGERAKFHSVKDIVKIEFALRRIEEDQYGLCPQCGGVIEQQRLEFEPEIVFCATCASALSA